MCEKAFFSLRFGTIDITKSASRQGDTTFVAYPHPTFHKVIATTLAARMSSSTDQTANLSLASHIISHKDTSAIQPLAQQQKRSLTWSHYHWRQPSNPFFLSRRAKEQGSADRTRRHDGKLGTLDGTLNSSELSEDLVPSAKPDPLHNIQIAEEVAPDDFQSNTKRSVPEQPHSNHTEYNFPQENRIQISIAIDLGKAINTFPYLETALCLDDNSLLLSDTVNEASAQHPSQSPEKLHDDLHLSQAHHRSEGTVRRKNMRTVSEDDYLLARGANPRTGVVTPSIYSESSSGDDRELRRIGEMPQPAKWRLKGDQWVSLGFDEPTPLPSPPNEHSRDRNLRIPPKLAQGRPPQYDRLTDGFNQTRFDKLTPANRPQMRQLRQRSASELQRVERNVYGAQATSLTARSSPRKHAQTGTENVIKRKPVGTPPGKQSAKNMFASNDPSRTARECMTARVNPVEHVRSSSMPTPRKFRFHRPEDVDKELPALPGETSTKKGRAEGVPSSQGIPFSGLRKGDWIEDVPNQANLDGWRFQKKYSRPPMNDIQCQSYLTNVTNSRGYPAMTLPMHAKSFENQQRRVNILPPTHGTCSAPLRSRPTIPQRHYQSSEVIHKEQRPTQPISTKILNTYHPSSIQPPSQDQATSRCREPAMKGNGVEGGSDVSTNPSPILSSTTSTTTPQTSPEDRLISSSWREIPSPLRSGRPKPNPPSRPAMSERAEGTQHVPQVSPVTEISKRGKSEMTYTSDTPTSAQNASVEGSPDRNLLPRPLGTSNGNTARLARLKKVAAEGTNTGQRLKDCPHCRESSLDVKSRHQPGLTQLPKNSSTENLQPKVDLRLPSGFSQGSPEDHSGCCAECCAVGCHGSCLGHRAPSTTSSSSGIASGIDAMKEAFRHSMRLSRRFRVRTSAGGSCETEAEETAELETPLSWEMGGPVSLGMPMKNAQRSFGSGSHTEKTSQGQRIASNASSSSMKTMDIPTNTGVGSVIEALMVPFGALRMWLKKHPQLLALMQVILVKLVDMGKHVLDTTSKAYRLAYVYSKTGRLSPGKGSSLSGLASDCVKAVTYCLILGAVAMMFGKVLAVIAGAASWVVWCVSWVAWIFKAVGLGILW